MAKSAARFATASGPHRMWVSAASAVRSTPVAAIARAARLVTRVGRYAVTDGPRCFRAPPERGNRNGPNPAALWLGTAILHASGGRAAAPDAYGENGGGSMAGVEPDVLRDRYWLNGAWGQGAGSTYWSGYDRTERTSVFVQQLHPRTAGDDAKSGAWPPGALARQVHRMQLPEESHLLQVRDVIEESGSLWVVMEPVVPRSLFSVMRDHRRLTPVAAANIGLEVATALETLHESGTAHGQVGPRGILFRHDGTAALPGYGLVPPGPGDAAPPVHPWRPHSQYTAPELTASRKQRDASRGAPTPQGDLWALGMTLFEMVEGRRPSRGPMPCAPVKALRDARPPHVHREREFAPLIEGLLAPHPGARPKVASVTSSLRAAAGRQEPVSDSHWAVSTRARRTHWQRIRRFLLQLGTLIGSRIAAAFMAGVVAAMLGLRLAGKSAAPDVGTSFLSAAVLGLASGLVVLTGKCLRHMAAYVIDRCRRSPMSDPPAQAPPPPASPTLEPPTAAPPLPATASKPAAPGREPTTTAPQPPTATAKPSTATPKPTPTSVASTSVASTPAAPTSAASTPPAPTPAAPAPSAPPPSAAPTAVPTPAVPPPAAPAPVSREEALAGPPALRG